MTSNINIQKVTQKTACLTHWEFRSNAGAVMLNNYVVVIDATMKPLAARVFRKKVEAQFGVPVKYFILTHCHSDHAMTLGEFKDTCIVGSEQAARKIQQLKKTEWSKEGLERWKQEKPEDALWLEDVEIVIPYVGFNKRIVLHDEGRSLEVMYGGGHTDCSVYAYSPEEKVLFAGDLLLGKAFPFAGDETVDPEKWMGVFEDWLSLDFKKIVPGHGSVVERDEVEKYLLFFKALKKNVQDVISAGKTVEEVVVPEFYEVPEDFMWLKTGTLRGFYEYYKKSK
ncbi:MAG: MBL fold metallo-hydrolase [Spirochaetales bacterium]|nr:MBL fold metallo-hydrolase [Spirochaetales bacterium]